MDVSTFSPLSAVIDPPTAVPAAGTEPDRFSRLIPPAAGRRGVLDGAFAVLDAVACADEGLGLTELARVTGLAKTSAYRLAEQLVGLGAVQCLARRYYVGPRMSHIGQRWQPEPLLRRCARAPVRAVAVHARATASLRILHEQRLRYVCAAIPHGHAYMPNPADPESIARTATGRVLYATQPADHGIFPDCWSRRQWRDLRALLRNPRATVVDRQDAFAGMCCVSAPVWWPNGACAGAVTVTMQANDPPAELLSLVPYAARRIGTALQQLEEK